MVCAALCIVSASESNQESDFSLAPTLIYAVPNDGPPNAPTIDVVPDPKDPHAVTVTLTVPPGGVAAAEYRLRRSSATAIDPHRMLIAQTGSVLPPVNGKPQVATFTEQSLRTIGGASCPMSTRCLASHLK